ncbi:ATP-binding protein [Terrarubrum flagellatum]|uniref:ATP-binding protein n=1 Tax=Terrirubrum flagellatum TaxID=2895980 RepID=UPI0031455E55
MDTSHFAFGDFQVLANRRLLLRSGLPIPLSSRAFDILLVFLRSPGEVIAKNDLIQRAWPNVHVDEGNLRVQISGLRKALGEDGAAARFIENVSGRGYSFIAPVTIAADSNRKPTPRAGSSIKALKAARHVFGRHQVVAKLGARLQETRLLTVVGPGGIGKTTVALEIAALGEPHYPDGVTFVDLTPINDGNLVPDAVAAALDAGEYRERGSTLEAMLQDRTLLIVLDNCEHVIDAVAVFVEQVQRAHPGVRILSTSREPLRAEGEWVHRLAPLEFPLGNTALTAAQALEYSAIRLFVDRAAHKLGGYSLTDDNATLVARICGRLDGIPLAIELAVGHLDSIGMRALLSSLDQGFGILSGGRRTALSRHQKMWAALDWSFGLLSETEATIFKALTIFSGGFTFAAARDVIGDAVAAGAFADGLSNLVAKSLVVADTDKDPVRYRLFEMTRAYGRERLEQSDRSEEFAERHAAYFLAMFEVADSSLQPDSTTEHMALCAKEVANIRAAIDWAFKSEQHVNTAVALTIAAVPLWTQLSMVGEWKSAVLRALEALKHSVDGYLPEKMQLHAALGGLQMHAGSGDPKSAAMVWQATLSIAEKLNDSEYQLRALWGIWIACTNRAAPRDALQIVDSFDRVAARTTEADRHVGYRIRGKSLHFCGNLDEAFAFTQRVLEGYDRPTNSSDVVRFQYDQRILAQATLARTLWLRGFFREALAEVQRMYAEAEALDHVTTLSNAIVDAAFPLTFLQGDLVAAEAYCSRLREVTDNYGLDIWGTYAQCFKGQILVRSNYGEEGVRELRSGIAKLESAGFIVYRSGLLATLAEGLADIGQLENALKTVDKGIAHCNVTDEKWCLAELHRVRGLILAKKSDASVSADAEKEFNEALRIARHQGAVAWELATTESFSIYLTARDRCAEAKRLAATAQLKLSQGAVAN